MTWVEFVAAVSEELPLVADRRGTEKFFDRSVRAAAADLQAFLPWLRVGHSEVWTEGFTVDGMAASHAVPAGGSPVIREVWLSHVEADEERPGSSNRTLLARRPWDWKDAMVVGNEQVMGCWALSPDLSTVLVAPYLMEGQTLTVVWDGVLDFGPITTVLTLGAGWSQPGVSLAVSHFVRERFAKVVDHDLASAQAHAIDYMKLRQRLYADFKERA